MQTTPPIESMYEEVLSYGVLGVVSIVFAFVIAVLWRSHNVERREWAAKLQEERDARLKDLNAAHSKGLEVSEKSTRALGSVANALDQVNDLVEAMHDQMQEDDRIPISPDRERTEKGVPE